MAGASDTATKPKRKKISWACGHCHKAHITCDSARPCKRCVQRGLQDTCQDAPRKRKKYLADVPPALMQPGRQGSVPSDAPQYEASYLSTGPSSVGMSPMFSSYPTELEQAASEPARDEAAGAAGGAGDHANTPNQHSEQDASLHYAPGQDAAAYGFYGDRKKRTNFLSSAADMEYSTLSNILSESFMAQYPGTPHDSTPNSGSVSPHVGKVSSPSTWAGCAWPAAGDGGRDPPNTQNINEEPGPAFDGRINQYALGPVAGRTVTFPEVVQQMEFLRQSDRERFHARSAESTVSFTIGASAAAPDDGNISFKEPEEIYARIKKPFSYTPGFHRLIAYLRRRFSKDKLVKMAKSMAVYRPSFIACTNSLREADLIFMEQCFHRTLLTYDNFIKVSGTPTIVWRRTGEIAYVGKEFTLLTGWTQQQLMGGRPTFIVELLDEASVVEYFELFSKIAFGDFLGATMTQCTLLTPQKDVKIRAGCMWTLKRDVFGIPMMVIGNFLPVM